MNTFSIKSLFLLLFFSCALFSGCKEEEESFTTEDLQLITNKQTIKANGNDTVNFTLTAKGKIISSDFAVMRKETETAIRQELFTTTDANTYTFYALYHNTKSNEVSVEATPLTLALQLDKDQLLANNIDQLTLTLTEDEIDVTSSSTFHYLLDGDTTAMEGNTFATNQSGQYIFFATYKERTVTASTPVTIATKKVTLTADRQQFKADGKETIHFTVDADGVDVTSIATIHYTRDSVITLDEPLFSTKRAATNTFYATYNDVQSDRVTLEAEYVERFFQKEHLIMAFTSNNCRNCPLATDALIELQRRKSGIHGIALHVRNHQCRSNLSGVLKETANSLSPETMFPSFIINLNQQLPVYFGDMQPYLQQAIKKSEKNGPPQTGIAIESTIEGKKIDFNVKVQTNVTDNYRFFAFVIEDRVIARQNIGKDESKMTIFNNQYSHQHVGTYSLSQDDPLIGIDLGKIERGDDVERSFSINTAELNVGRDVKLSDCHIVAYTLRNVYGTFVIDNVTSSPVNGAVDFKYLNK